MAAQDAAFDKIMELAGNDGPFQWRFNFIYNALMVVCGGMSFMNIILALNVPDHWCQLPEGRENTNFTVDEWKRIWIPNVTDEKGHTSLSKCEMYNISWTTIQTWDYGTSNWTESHKNFQKIATTLDSTNKSVKWDVVGDTKEFPNPFYKLIVRQFLLGHTAKEDEYNVVEVETSSMNESKPNQVKVPVAVLKAGETRSIQTVLEFPDPPVTFKLVEGSGPIYIHGQTVPGNYEIEDSTELSGEEEEEDEDEEVQAKPAKASKNPKNGKI